MNCSWIDDYLCRLLSPEDTRAFELHAANCPECAAAIERDAGLTELLREAVAELEPVPGRLLQSAAVALEPPRAESAAQAPQARSRERGRQGLWAVGSSLAALLLLAAMLPPPDRSGVQVARTDAAINQPEHSADSEPLPPPAVSLPAGVIGFPVESSDPNIRIVMLYTQAPSEVTDDGSPDPTSVQ